MKEYSAEIAKAIKLCLEKSGVSSILFNEEKGTIDFLYEYEQGEYLRYVRIFIGINPNDFHVYVYFPFSVCFTTRGAFEFFEEFLFQTNKKVNAMREKDEKIGVFVPNYGKGDLYYMYIEECNGIVPTENTISVCVRNAIKITGLFASGFVDVLYRWDDAKTAMEKCENLARRRSEIKRILRMGQANQESDINE